MSQRYRTIVVDPPWPHPDSGKRSLSTKGFWAERHVGTQSIVPYERLTVAEIEALPVEELTEADSHLYLWTTNRFLLDGYRIAQSWGFQPSTLLTWCKEPRGLGLGGAFTITTEFIIFARRGSLAALRRSDSTWFKWKRPYLNGVAAHSHKPEGFLDLVEQISPEPRAELFARRARFGWDYPIGDQALGGVAA